MLFYLNLTNGIEYLKDIGFTHDNIRFIRIQSTALEQGHMTNVISDLDNDFLMNLAMGNKCLILDRSSRSSSISRALWYGVPWITYVLERKWFGKIPDKCFISNNKANKINVAEYFSKCYNELPVSVLRKLNYFKNYLFCDKVDIDYYSISTIHDGDKEYYRKIIQDFVLDKIKE